MTSFVMLHFCVRSDEVHNGEQTGFHSQIIKGCGKLWKKSCSGIIGHTDIQYSAEDYIRVPWLHGPDVPLDITVPLSRSATRPVLIEPKILVSGSSSPAALPDVLMTDSSVRSMKQSLPRRFCLEPLDKD